jgi:hypothetical protein
MGFLVPCNAAMFKPTVPGRFADGVGATPRTFGMTHKQIVYNLLGKTSYRGSGGNT